MALTQIKTDAISDDAVTLAKQAAGTDGQIITYDASGNPTAVGPGTDGQVLTSTGAGSPPAFEDLPASGPSLANDANNRVITGTGSGLNGEANLTFDGNNLSQTIDAAGEGIKLTASGNHWMAIEGDANRTNTTGGILAVSGKWNGTQVGLMEIQTGQDTTNKDDGQINFYTTPSGGSLTSRMVIDPDGKVKLPDSGKLICGAGEDLEIYHNGSNSYIDNSTGTLIISTDAQTSYKAQTHQFETADGSETIATFTADGAVDLYYDNAKKFETTSYGTKVTGRLAATTSVTGSDNVKVILGDGDDLQIYHDGNNSYIHDDGTGSLILRSSRVSFNDTSNNEWARIGSDGMHIGGTAYDGGGADPALYVRNNGGRQVKIHNPDDGTCGIQLTNSGSGQGDDNGLQIALLSSDDAWFNLVESAAMRFCTNQTERMRIQSNGRLHLGNDLGNDHAGLLQVINTGSSGQTGDCLVFFETAAEDWCLKSNSNISGSASHYHIDFEEEGTRRGKISGDHGSNVSYLQGSDYRWKENIVDMTGTEGLEICKKLKPRKYNWIKNREGTGKINTVDGFIAHEVVEAGVLGAVQGEKDAVNSDGSIDGQTLDYGQMTPVLAAGIKGLIAEVETLKTKVAALEAA